MVGKDGYIQCDLCNKKFTKINYDSHLLECKKKYKEKKGNNTFVNRTNNNNLFGPNNPSSPAVRQPTMPAVTYGGFSNKPNFNLKFGKNH